MILHQSTESKDVDSAESRAVLSMDGDTTADLSFENTADLAPAPDSSLVHDAHTANAPTTIARPLAPMPGRRTLGFFAFAACALVAVLGTAQPPAELPSPSKEAVASTNVPAKRKQLASAGSSAVAAPSQKTSKPPEIAAAQTSATKPATVKAQAPLGVLAFKSRSVVTSEQAIAAVFIIERSQVVKGRALVHWVARSGSADAGIDFSDASGAVRFADGQRQVAIYVRLRNDLLKEEDETFKVCLRSPRQARIAGRSCAEVTILDDDHIGPT